jgi:transposase
VSYIDPLDSYCGDRLLTEAELRRVAYNIHRTTGEQLRKMRPPPVVTLDAKWARVVPVCIEELIQARQRIAELEAACRKLLDAPHDDHFAARLNTREMEGIEAIRAAMSNAEGGGK